MKQATMETPDKIRFESPFKVFNEQTNYLGTGNVLATTQYSKEVRAYSEIDRSGYVPQTPGYLQEFDLEHFKNHYHLPARTLNQVRRHLREQSGWLYLFRHYGQQDQCLLDGLVLTDKEHRHIETWYLNPLWKAEEAVREARAYVCTEESLAALQGAVVAGGDEETHA